MASNKAELESIIKQFKVSDLATLLGFAGQNKMGKKHDLQRRALNLIRYRVPMPLEMKIRNIYRQIQHDNKKNTSSDNRYDSNYYTKDYSFQSSTAYSSAAARAINQCSDFRRKNNIQNYMCVNPFDDSVPRHPTVNGVNFNYSHHLEVGLHIPEPRKLVGLQFKELSFYKHIKDIVPLTTVIPDNKTTDNFEYHLPFQISETDHISLKKSAEKDCRLQIQLRFCLLNESTLIRNLQEDSLPLALSVHINDRYVILPPPIPSTNKQGMLLKRFNFPINVTPQCSKRNRNNNLYVSWSTESKQLYGLSIRIVEKISSAELIEKLKFRSADETKKYITAKLNEDDDIEATSWKVSLVCPLGKIRMMLPSRATTCEHIQCFDAVLFIKMNEVKSVWLCPVCNKSCLYENLFIDEFFMSILKCDKLSLDVTDIQINSDCSWEPVVERKRKLADNDDSKVDLSKKLKLDLPEHISCTESGIGNEDKSSCDRSMSIVSLKEEENSISSDDIINLKVCSESTPLESADIAAKNDVIVVDLISDGESEVDVMQINSDENSGLQVATSSTDSSGQSKFTPPVFDIYDSDDNS